MFKTSWQVKQRSIICPIFFWGTAGLVAQFIQTLEENMDNLHQPAGLHQFATI